MYNGNDIANLRIQLHMFIYPTMIDDLLNNIPEYCGGHDNIRYMEYNANYKLISLVASDQCSNDMLIQGFKNLFSVFLRNQKVADALRENINDEAYALYQEMSSNDDIYQFMFNVTNCINNGCIIQL